VVRAEAAARLRPRPIAARPYTLLDVFTDRPLAGNGLAVVQGADGLSDEAMLAFARETRLSETSFVQSAEGGADYRHRIFTMGGEIAFAGHPSLGAAVAVARARGEAQVTYVQQTQPGEQAVDVRLDGLRASVSMLQEPPEFGPELDPDDVLGLVGLDGAEADPALPCQVVSTGVPQVIACVRDVAALRRVLPAYDRIGRLLGEHEAITLYLAAVDPEAGTARARSFMRSAEMGEDPATGSSVGPLCAHVAARTGAQRLVVEQGIEMGRPSRLEAAVDGDTVRVGGDAVILAEGTVHLDMDT
jgi:trans-2,3-dihydro-3-hydroxyanthranilate isomerase